MSKIIILKEVRCKKCKKLLGKINGIAEIKCPRCGTCEYSS
ncbi:Com family DNA-binding transcriptional regulator [Brevibacillus sp. NRS-1366]